MKILLSTISLFALISCASTEKSESFGEYTDNTVISSKVKTKLIMDKVVPGTSLNVQSFKGTVLLSGFVENEKQRDKAIEIAEKVKGVEEVKSSIIIK